MVSHGLDREILLQYQVQEKIWKGGYYFPGRKSPQVFFQLIEGCIKMVSHGEGWQSLHTRRAYLQRGNVFGEPPLILNLPLPIFSHSGYFRHLHTAVQRKFRKKMLVEQPPCVKWSTYLLAAKTYEKSKRNTMLTGQAPEYRIQFILDEMKENRA